MSRRAQLLEVESMLLDACRRSYKAYLSEPLCTAPPPKLIQSLKVCHERIAAGLAAAGAEEQVSLEQTMLELQMAMENVRKQMELRQLSGGTTLS